MVELVVRLVFSLTVVVGLLLGLARLSAKRFRGSTGALVQVVHRQALSRSSALAVVTIGSRVLVLGTTEQQVQLLTELDPEELELALTGVLHLGPADQLVPSASEADGDAGTAAPHPEPGPLGVLAALRPSDLGKGQEARKSRQRMGALSAARASDGALAGSLLSAHTWKQAFTAAIGGNDRDAAS
jgi:flagellar protein FliO/FliZ